MKSWRGKETDQNIIARSLTLLIFAMQWALCGRPQPEHESVTFYTIQKLECGFLFAFHSNYRRIFNRL